MLCISMVSVKSCTALIMAIKLNKVALKPERSRCHLVPSATECLSQEIWRNAPWFAPLIFNGDCTNHNATQPEMSPEVICSQSASLCMLGAKLQRIFFTLRTQGWHLEGFQKTWVVSSEFDLELNFLLLPYRQNCFSKSMKMLFIVKKYQTNILICLLLQVNWLPLWWMDNTQTRRVRYQSRKLASESNLVY